MFNAARISSASARADMKSPVDPSVHICVHRWLLLAPVATSLLQIGPLSAALTPAHPLRRPGYELPASVVLISVDRDADRPAATMHDVHDLHNKNTGILAINRGETVTYDMLCYSAERVPHMHKRPEMFALELPRLC